MKWNIEYGKDIKHYISLEESGEPNPLSTRPMITNLVDKWFLDTYMNIKSLSGFEYQITISDFTQYFDIYPIPFNKTTIISIIKSIENSVESFRKERDDAKRKSKESKK